MIKPKLRRLKVFYDLETTGIDTVKDRVVQFAAKIRGDNGYEESYTSYVNPAPRRMSSMAAKVTGIVQKQLTHAPCFATMWKEFQLRVTASGQVDELQLVGHNSATFDDCLMVAELERCGLDVARPLGSITVRCGDTLRAARKAGGKSALGLPNLKLTTLFQACTGNPLNGAHDALVDCEAVDKLAGWSRLKRHIELDSWGKRVDSLRDRQRRRGLPVVSDTPTIPLLPAKKEIRSCNTAPSQKRCLSQVKCLICQSVYSAHFPTHVCTNTK